MNSLSVSYIFSGGGCQRWHRLRHWLLFSFLTFYCKWRKKSFAKHDQARNKRNCEVADAVTEDGGRLSWAMTCKCMTTAKTKKLLMYFSLTQYTFFPCSVSCLDPDLWITTTSNSVCDSKRSCVALMNGSSLWLEERCQSVPLSVKRCWATVRYYFSSAAL